MEFKRSISGKQAAAIATKWPLTTPNMDLKAKSATKPHFLYKVNGKKWAKRPEIGQNNLGHFLLKWLFNL